MNLNVDKYNTVIDRLAVEYKETVIVLDPLSDAKEELFYDGYHCNANGMNCVYELIRRCLDEYLINRK
jgi:hypothetical protein